MGFHGKNQRFYEFGSFRIDAANHLLLQEGRPVALQPKTFDLLLLLIERAGEVVGKEEIMTRLWPGTSVEESNLTQNIYLLRKILGRGPGGGQLIETIPKRGYKFAGVVSESRQPEVETPPPAADEKPDRKLTFGDGESDPTFTPDGQAVIYTAAPRSGKNPSSETTTRCR